ncbi:hypothetical protein PLEOSDRAFT_168999 [Pleurotus ostreatus PC15]|uniref:non-specific serine/threonine protein kinase n=1 Tax=Pleurotus ostreatus (strain PC15) TaxID=1137138 RepID=A0A067NSL5_PLEO1|nr:hypothetical protein PLEOSDRAFT_168999 [Pleurotus ostreatus PC15]
MHFRQLLWTSVLMACAIAAPAPISERDFDTKVETRRWGAHPRYGGNDAYRVAVLEARGPPKPAPRPVAKPIAKPIARPPARPVKPAAPAKPPVKAVAPAKPPTKPPAKPGPGTPPPPPPTKPGQQQCGVRNGKGKRAFDVSCSVNSLELNGVTRSITKLSEEDQGNSAITYKVDGGWPDPRSGQIYTAYAKTGKKSGVTFDDEIRSLRRVDQLLANGAWDGHNFIVFRGVSGKVKIQDTSFFMTLYPLMQKGDVKGCEAEVMKKIDLIVEEAKVYVKKFKTLHTDIQPNNILWDKAGNNPTLIDWGQATNEETWDSTVEAKVRKQAEFSHLKGEGKLCHDLSK